MRRMIAIVGLVLISSSTGHTQGSIVEIYVSISEIALGAQFYFPMADLPEGSRQGGLMGVSGLSNPSIVGGPGYFTIPPGEFLLAECATIRWEWFDGGGNSLLKVTYYINNGTGLLCPRPRGRFLFKSKAAVIGVRG